jgi:tellurite resistance protein
MLDSMQRRTPDFARVLAAISQKPDGDFTSLRGNEIDGVIELAYRMASANGDASPDELEALRALIKHLRPDASVGAVLEDLADKLGSAGSASERVRAAAASLPRQTARELAYKAVYAVAVFDLETNAEERELENLVINVLGLDDKRAHELGLEATHALLA